MFDSFPLIKIYSSNEGVCFEFGITSFRFHILFFDYYNGKLGRHDENKEEYESNFFRSILSVLYLLCYRKMKKEYALHGRDNVLSNISIENNKIRMSFFSFEDEFHIKVLKKEDISSKMYKIKEFNIESKFLKIGLINKILNRKTELWFFEFKIENISNIFSFAIDLKTIEWAMALTMSLKNNNTLFIDFDLETYEVLDVKLVE